MLIVAILTVPCVRCIVTPKIIKDVNETPSPFRKSRESSPSLGRRYSSHAVRLFLQLDDRAVAAIA